MLPMQGLFQSLPCPYYVAGLCERPHCLFRHTKTDIVVARSDQEIEIVKVVEKPPPTLDKSPVKKESKERIVKPMILPEVTTTSSKVNRCVKRSANQKLSEPSEKKFCLSKEISKSEKEKKPSLPKKVSTIEKKPGLSRQISTGEKKQDLSREIPTIPSCTESPPKSNVATRHLRTAHVPSNRRVATESSRNKMDDINEDKTIAQTANKGRARLAHVPTNKVNSNTMKRPVVSVDSPSKRSSKVPVKTRQMVLDKFYDSAMQINNTNHQDAFKRAVEQEHLLETQSKTKQVYMSLAVSKIRAIRSEVEAKPDNANSAGSHHPFTKMTGNALYMGLKGLQLTEEQLVANGNPRIHPSGEPGRAVAERTFWTGSYVSEPTRRTCDRCKKVYSVSETGQQLHEDECIFHPGRKTMNRVNRVWVKSHDCCGDERGSNGCTTLNYHVPKAHPVTITKGYVSALKPAGEDHTMGFGQWDIVALDCEMVYTTAGNHLARATFVGADGKVLYDTIVKPIHQILDYNTQFSGLTPELMSNAKSTLTDVQAVILSHLKKNSILIGHSIESDLIALRLLHDCIIDTSVLYPHKKGEHYKRALRMLSSEYLHKIIQESTDGHDSAEDARTALELVLKFLETKASK